MSVHFNAKFNKKTAILAALFGVSLVIFELNFMEYVKSKNATVEYTATVVDPLAHLSAEELAEFNPDTVNISIASELNVNNKTYESYAQIKNIKNYNYYFIVDILLDDSRELVYQSSQLHPDQVIDVIKINPVLDIGKYKATAYFKAYDIVTNQYVATVALGVDLNVTKGI